MILNEYSFNFLNNQSIFNYIEKKHSPNDR